MKSKDAKVFLEALAELEREKGISKESLLETVEIALLAAYKKNYGDDHENVEVTIDRNSGDVKIFEVRRIVPDGEVEDKTAEISLEEAYNYRKRIKVGDDLRIPIKCEDFKRNAIQNGKQIVIQKVREAERLGVFNKFKDKEGDLMNGIIRRIDDRRNIHIDFDGFEAMLSTSEQSPADLYRVGERIKIYVVSVEQTSKFPKIIISRKNENLLRRLFELEIPEITDGLIEIKSAAREVGSRAKVAVYSSDPNIDTVGACIGQRGLRIKNVVNELNGEKIDIIEWKEDVAEFVAVALSPAQVKSVEINEAENTANVVVKDDQLSLAIGKNGQNARLVAKLTGMRVDIKTISSLKEGEDEKE